MEVLGREDALSLTRSLEVNWLPSLSARSGTYHIHFTHIHNYHSAYHQSLCINDSCLNKSPTINFSSLQYLLYILSSRCTLVHPLLQPALPDSCPSDLRLPDSTIAIPSLYIVQIQRWERLHLHTAVINGDESSLFRQ